MTSFYVRGYNIKELKVIINIRDGDLQDNIRVCKIHGGVMLWYHLDCFAEVRDDLKFLIPAAKLRGLDLLTDADQSRVKDTLVEVVQKKDKVSPDEICSKVKNALPKIELDEELLKLKKIQNEKMYEYRDQLSQLSKATLRKLMLENGLDFLDNETVRHSRTVFLRLNHFLLNFSMTIFS